MTGSLISLAFWVVVMGALALSWYRHIERKSLPWRAESEKRAAKDPARFEEKQKEWEAEQAKARERRRGLMAEVESSSACVNQFWIERGLEPTPPPAPEPSESSP